jgi:hypothetical protein
MNIKRLGTSLANVSKVHYKEEYIMNVGYTPQPHGIQQTERNQDPNLDLFELVSPLLMRMRTQPNAIGGTRYYSPSTATDKHLDELMRILLDYTDEIFEDMVLSEEALDRETHNRLCDEIRQKTAFGRHIANLIAIVFGRMLKVVYVGNATPKFDEETLRRADHREEVALCMTTLGLSPLWAHYGGIPRDPVLSVDPTATHVTG